MPKLALSSVLQRRVGSRSTRKIIEAFAERTGMVYFGYVSQMHDEHHILRGMTVSTNHHDDHYCIGTIDGYDAVFVERTDTLKSGKKHRWHIMEFDLKTTADIPHAFIGSGKHGMGFHELMSMKYSSLAPTSLGQTTPYPAAFLRAFTAYVTPAYAVRLETLLPPQTAEVVSTHFSGLVVELTEQAVYIYSEKPHLTTELLTTMAKNGAWLASQIDKNSRQL